MTATLAASTAILKVRYPDGKLPSSVYKRFKYVATATKREDFTGESRVLALQHEYPQGSSADFQVAQGSLQQGRYNKFTVTRVEHFGVARIKGQALKAAEGDEGALVDLWKNETDGISKTELMNHEIYAFGNGSGVLGQVASGQGGTTVTLSITSDIAKFALGMRLQAVSDATLSPTLRGGGATVTVTGIDRSAGTLTAAATWNATISGLAANDYLVRAGDYASGGTATVITGAAGWVVGGSSPGTLFGLSRNVDPVRLAGQAYNASGVPLEEAVQEACALAAQQGGDPPDELWMHVRDFANLKKALGTKVTYPKTQVKGTMANVGFTGVEIEGDDGPVRIMTSPFITRYTGFLGSSDARVFDSAGPAPHLQDYDKANFLRTPGDDSQEVRFASYVQHYWKDLSNAVVFSNLGA